MCGKALYKYGVSLIETNIDRNGNIVERNASPAAAKINELLKSAFSYRSALAGVQVIGLSLAARPVPATVGQGAEVGMGCESV